MWEWKEVSLSLLLPPWPPPDKVEIPEKGCGGSGMEAPGLRTEIYARTWPPEEAASLTATLSRAAGRCLCTRSSCGRAAFPHEACWVKSFKLPIVGLRRSHFGFWRSAGLLSHVGVGFNYFRFFLFVCFLIFSCHPLVLMSWKLELCNSHSFIPRI